MTPYKMIAQDLERLLSESFENEFKNVNRILSIHSHNQFHLLPEITSVTLEPN